MSGDFEKNLLKTLDAPRRKRFDPYCRLSWRHWGLGVFIYAETYGRELAISVGPICFGIYHT